LNRIIAKVANFCLAWFLLGWKSSFTGKNGTKPGKKKKKKKNNYKTAIIAQ
jgi:hypothetical protein